MLDLKLVFGAAVVCAVVLVMPARAAKVSAIVEDLAAPDAGLELMDYVEVGRVITLGASGSITLGYLRSCWRDSIVGGVITIGARKSEVVGGALRRERVDCDGGAIQLSAAEAGEAGAAIFRAPDSAWGVGPREPRVTLFGASPVITLAEPGGEVIIERLDATSKVIVIPVAGKFVDLAQSDQALEPGGLYRVRVGTRALVFKIDPSARPGPGPVVGRLLML